MADLIYENYISNLIDSMILNLGVSDNNFLLIKHYNTFDLGEEFVCSIAEERQDAVFLYHTFDSNDMLTAYEPFIGWIKKLFNYSSYYGWEHLFEDAQVYALHRPIFRSYFDEGICKRHEEILVGEVQYERKLFVQEIVRMLKCLSKGRPLVLVLNKLHVAGASTLKIIMEIIREKHCADIALIATYNENTSEQEYIKEAQSELIDTFDEYDCIIDWTLSEETPEFDVSNVFKFDSRKLSEYKEKLVNMLNMLALDQASYYLDVLYHKFEVERVKIEPEYKFDILEIYATVAMLMDKSSDAFLYCNGMRTLIQDNPDKDWIYRYNYLIAQVHMYGFQLDIAESYVKACEELCIDKNDEKLDFKLRMLKLMIRYRGWRDIWLRIEDDKELDVERLVDESKRYKYYNHLAHIYVYSFDNDESKIKLSNKDENILEYFNEGIRYASFIGNDQFLIEAYKKNIMIASTNGYYNVANNFYAKCFDVVKKNNDLFEEANIYNGMGYNCCTMEKFAKANEYFNKALVIHAQLRNIEQINETIYNMAINAILAEEYSKAELYLNTCFKILKITKENTVRVCNVSKLYGLRALCYYNMKILYNCKINVQYMEQFLGHVIEHEENDYEGPHLWDDDLVLYFFISGVILEHENKLIEALECMKKARKYVERSRGSMFFNLTPYSIAYARICKKLQMHEEAVEILNRCIEFCDEKGYIYKKDMILAELEGRQSARMDWNLPLRDITLEQIIQMATHIGTIKNYDEQKKEIDFMSIWLKFINNRKLTLSRTIENALTTFMNNYNINDLIFIRMEEGKPVLKYKNTSYEIDAGKVNYVVDYFNENRSEFVVTRLDKGYPEYKKLIDRIFGFSSIYTIIGAPLFVNEQLDSVFILGISMNNDWNYKNKKFKFDENDLSIIMMLFRQLLDAIDRIEAQDKVEHMNKKLKNVNESLQQMAITDTLTGLFNRQGFNEELDAKIHSTIRKGKELEISLLYADLDNFKYYNDTFGHDIGDIILKEFSKLIKGICKGRGFAVRYGGDEFILVIYSSNREEIEEAAKDIYRILGEKKGFVEHISQTLGTSISIPEEKYVSCSVGIAHTHMKPTDNIKEKMDATLKQSDEMMYYVKKTTKHRYVFYEDIKNMIKENDTKE